MAAGAGVVLGGDNPGYRSVMNDKRFLFDPSNTEEFARILVHYINSRSTIADVHDEQQENLCQYDVEVVGQKLLKIYESCKNSRTRG